MRGEKNLCVSGRILIYLSTQLTEKRQKCHCAKTASELALLPGESCKVKVRGNEGLEECCGGKSRCWNLPDHLQSDTA